MCFLRQGICKKGNLKIHVSAVHEKVTPYKCELCEKRFAMKAHFNEHVKEVHEKLKSCLKGFGQNGHLQRHIKTFHETL